jgi:hypothetical protein
MKKAIKGMVSVLAMVTLLSGAAFADGGHGHGGGGGRDRSSDAEWARSEAMHETARAIEEAASSGRSEDVRRATRIGSASARWASGGRGSRWFPEWLPR